MAGASESPEEFSNQGFCCSIYIKYLIDLLDFLRPLMLGKSFRSIIKIINIEIWPMKFYEITSRIYSSYIPKNSNSFFYNNIYTQNCQWCDIVIK